MQLRRFILAASAACLAITNLRAGDSTDLAKGVFKYLGKHEAYLVTIGTVARCEITARFDVIDFDHELRLVRTVTIAKGELSEELLSSTESAALLNKFRTFDWNAQPAKKTSIESGCSVSLPPWIGLKARAQNAYREMEGDATLIPALADFVGAVISPKENPSKADTTGTSDAANR